MSFLDVQREKVQIIVDLAKAMAQVPGLIVVGGYAVSSRTTPRYSQDLDIILPNKIVPEVERLLANLHFEPGQRFENPNKDVLYGDETVRWSREKDKATVDVMGGGLMDRNVKVWVPYELVAREASREKLRNGVGIPDQPELMVASAEVLIGLKMQPQRDQDVADLISLAGIASAETTTGILVEMVGSEKAVGLTAKLVKNLGSNDLANAYGAQFAIKKRDAERAVERAKAFYGKLFELVGPR